jgi:hypothetical protein
MDYGTFLFGMLAVGTAFLGLLSIAEARGDLKRSLKRKASSLRGQGEEYKKAA